MLVFKYNRYMCTLQTHMIQAKYTKHQKHDNKKQASYNMQSYYLVNIYDKASIVSSVKASLSDGRTEQRELYIQYKQGCTRKFEVKDNFYDDEKVKMSAYVNTSKSGKVSYMNHINTQI